MDQTPRGLSPSHKSEFGQSADVRDLIAIAALERENHQKKGKFGKLFR